jgi:chromosome segregation ATPase
MGIFGKSKKQKAKEAEELAVLNGELEERQKKATEHDQQKADATKKQEELQKQLNDAKKAFEDGQAAFDAEKAKYDAEMAKLEAHNKVIAKLKGQQSQTMAAQAKLAMSQRLLQEEKEALEQDTSQNSSNEAIHTARLTAAKAALTALQKSEESHAQQLVGAIIAGSVSKHEEQFAREQHERMVKDLDECRAQIPTAKKRQEQAEDVLKPVLEAHEIAAKILEEHRGVARAQEAEEAKHKGVLGVAQQKLASVEHSKAQNEAELASTEKLHTQRATDLMIIQREISDLDNRHKATRKDIQETAQAQQNAEERLEAARRRFATEQATLERGVAERQELEVKVDDAEEDLRTAKAARERSETLLEALKSEMTAKITELTWIQKECSELRTMSTKNLKELSTFVDKRNAELRSFRANQNGAQQEAVISASERQKVQQKETAKTSAMNLLNSQRLRNDEDIDLRN